ncbi:fimbrial protein [Escherichia marmotae]|uniref:fimbrial protein n=1 Tax=Escherichia marmotae TaxID=1499973 RepID=UPI001F2FDB24|nr:fimbrial protein [Escherichia marmotae]MCE5378019.1 fimbrial protein [Escherichia marmotae]MEC9831024.1 fimbrial protein [Escherichia marmotae]MED8860992.1 fimbrial protein [Escherichia marmotae]MED8964324.1 fimbrial protein [Escherichia marmotae]MED9031895.1 fimbrial protein [Escherichia marmotae]
MKKLVLGSAILAVLGMTSTAMAANSGTVNFTGAVSTATCNLSLKNSAGSDIANVELGTLSNTATANGTAVDFKLVPQESACLTKTAATMEWNSPTLNATGMSNAATNGTNATMALQAVNATETDKMVKQGNTTFNFTGTSGISSFNYRAQLVKPTGALTAGVFNASANYIIAYK